MWELGQFVALVNDDLARLRDISPASGDFLKEVNGRQKIMELEIRNDINSPSEAQLIERRTLSVPTASAFPRPDVSRVTSKSYIEQRHCGKMNSDQQPSAVGFNSLHCCWQFVPCGDDWS
jgi:hypothetical protein